MSETLSLQINLSFLTTLFNNLPQLSNVIIDTVYINNKYQILNLLPKQQNLLWLQVVKFFSNITYDHHIFRFCKHQIESTIFSQVGGWSTAVPLFFLCHRSTKKKKSQVHNGGTVFFVVMTFLLDYVSWNQWKYIWQSCSTLSWKK